jgi:hypothetical protein
MATFDQLPAEQKAIIELVTARGRSYDDLADVLQITTSRVRELAREALTSLSPVTADRVDPDWRAQIADYVLGQQTGPESTATRGHLRRSESGRAWTLSLLDSLDDLYSQADTEADGFVRPAAPEIGDGGPARRRAREPRPDRARREKRPGRAVTVAGDDDGDGAATLTPDAARVVLRRRLLAALAAVVVAAGATFGVIQLTGDDDDGEPRRAGNTQSAAQGQGRILGQLELRPVKGQKGQGVAAIVENQGKLQLLLRAGVAANERNQAYEVWLYNDAKDAVSLGAGIAQQGLLQGRQELPADLLERYRYIDISLEPLDRNTKHSGNSIIRGDLQRLQPVQQGQGAPPEGGAAPAPGGTQPGGEGGALPPPGGGGQAPAPQQPAP